MDLDALAPTHTTLPSGLRVVIIPRPGLHRVVIDAHLRVGSRFESASDNGISHFLEHMEYRGTPDYPSAHEQALAFEELGGTLVATTAADTGSMTIATPPENFKSVLELYARVFQTPLLRGIEIERGIVSEEILESLDDEGKQVDPDNLLRTLVFGAHPLGFPITGPIEHLEHFDEANLRAHHQAHYVGSGTVIGVAGPVDPERVIAQVEECFKDLPRGALSQVSPPPDQGGVRWRYVRHAASQTALRLGFRAPSCTHPDEPAMELLLRTLDDGMSTRLYQQICDTKGLCYDVSAGFEAYEDAGLIELCAETAHERALDVLDELLDVVARLRDDGPSEEELEKARRRHRWQLREMLDHAEELTSFYGLGELAGLSRTPLERQEELEAVSRQRVLSVAQHWLCPANLSALAVGTLSKRVQTELEGRVRAFD